MLHFFQKALAQPLKYSLSLLVFSSLLACVSQRQRVNDAKRAQSLYELGLSLYNDGRYPDSVDALLQAKAADENRTDIRVQLGLNYMKLERLPEAEREINEACVKQVNSPECWNNLAVVYLKMKKPLAAVKSAERALSIVTYATPELALANMAQAKSLLKEWPEAQESLKKAERLSPENCDIKILLCSVLIQENNLDDALREAKMAGSLCPGSSSAHLWEAFTYYKMGDRRLAYDKYKKVVKLFHSDDVQIYGTKALENLQNRIPVDMPPL